MSISAVRERAPDWCSSGRQAEPDCRRWLEQQLELPPTDLGTKLGILATDLPAGVPVASAGRASRCAYVIRWGGVEVRRAAVGASSQRRAVLAILGPGDVVGDVPLLLGRAFSHDVVTTAPVRLLSIDAPDFLRLMARQPAVAARLARSLALQLVETQQRLDELLAGNLDQQLAALLLDRAPRGGEVALTHRQVAELLGAQRSSITTALARLERRGLLRRGYGHVTVVDPDGLRRQV